MQKQKKVVNENENELKDISEKVDLTAKEQGGELAQYTRKVKLLEDQVKKLTA